MDRTEFWAIIEDARGRAKADPERHVKAVRKRLAGSTRDGVLSFNGHFNQCLADAYRWDLWGAAYLINGGCSDDGFHYFRGWLVSLGRVAFEAAVRSPDTLAERVQPTRAVYESEDFCCVAYDAWCDLTGEDEMPPAVGTAADPAGERWDFDDDDEMRRRLPALGKLYLG